MNSSIVILTIYRLQNIPLCNVNLKTIHLPQKVGISSSEE